MRKKRLPARSADALRSAPAGVPGRARVLIADDHAVVRAGLRLMLGAEPDLAIVGEATTAAEAVALARELQPDIVLLDVAMPGGSGLEALTTIGQLPNVRVLLLTAAIEKADVILGLQRGARGIVMKDAATQVLLESIRAVLKGEYCLGNDIVAELVERVVRGRAPVAAASTITVGLTPREREIAAEVAKGRSNRDIAELFAVSEDTVKHHLTNIFDKAGVSNRVELALFALDQGLDKAS